MAEYRYIIPIVNGRPKYEFRPEDKKEKIKKYVIHGTFVEIVSTRYHEDLAKKEDVKVEKIK